MNLLDIRRYEMLWRVRDFGASNVDQFPPDSPGGEMFVAVATATQDLSVHATGLTSSVGASQESTVSKAASRAAVQDGMTAISRTARALALDMPGLDEKFRVPRSPRDQVLIQTARAFLQDAKPIADRFIRFAMPSTFMDDLASDIDDFERAISDQGAGGSAHVSASTSVDQAMEKGMMAVRRLDAIVVNQLRDDLPRLAAWKNARHIAYPSRSKGAATSQQAQQAQQEGAAAASA